MVLAMVMMWLWCGDDGNDLSWSGVNNGDDVGVVVDGQNHVAGSDSNDNDSAKVVEVWW